VTSESRDDAKVLTAKGARQAEAVLEAAIRCLGEDGYAGTTLQRVADAAGVQKRMVLYYFGSREHLIATVLERVGDRFLDDLAERVGGLSEPAALVDAVTEMFLAQTEDRALLTAYFGLLAESATDPVLSATFARLRERTVVIVDELLDRVEAAGHELSMERRLLVLAGFSLAHGIGLELMTHGRTAELERAIGLARVGAPLMLFD
jgi:AcrR family transcriptional regulator